jgi:hypothetical protein
VSGNQRLKGRHSGRNCLCGWMAALTDLDEVNPQLISYGVHSCGIPLPTSDIGSEKASLCV